MLQSVWRVAGWLAPVLMATVLMACPRSEPVGPQRRAPARPTKPTHWLAVSAGIDHTCAVGRDRTAWCWGSNQRGQLGDTTLTDRGRPTRVHGLRDVALVAAGYRRTFALTTTGELWGWGTVKSGKLERSTLLRHARPRRVPIPEPVRDYRIGPSSCALTRAGNLWCWRGQSGALPESPAATPRKLAGLPKITDFDSGNDHFCAVDASRQLWCWGKNGEGQLGNGTKAASTNPIRVTGLPDVSAVVCGSASSCVITVRGAVWCWGKVGPPKPVPPTQLDEPGDSLPEPGEPVVPQPTAVVRPKPLSGLQDVVSLVLGWPSTWARTRQGHVLQWKSSAVHTAKRVRIPGAGKAQALRFGSEHRCVLDTRGQVRCWGLNNKGQLGNGTKTAQQTPSRVLGLPALKQLSVGNHHACGLSRNDRIWCWGDDTAGQLGLDSLRRWKSPRLATVTLRDARHGAAGPTQACAVDQRGDVWCWGYLSWAKLPERARGDYYTPRKISGIGNAVAVASNDTTVCALKRDSTVWCWGRGGWGGWLLGRLRKHFRLPRPMPIVGPKAVTHISMGGDHACAIARDRKVRCWGGEFKSVFRGGIWDGKVHPLDLPHTKEVFHGAVALSSGYRHSCAVAQDGSAWCWGKNRFGELGDGTRKALGVPVQVKGLGGVRSIAAGTYFSCAVTKGGDVWCWGYNGYGTLGTTQPPWSLSPRRIRGLPKTSAVYAGYGHMCALTARSTLWCWGHWSADEKNPSPDVKPTPMAGLRNIKHAWLGSGFTCALDNGGVVRCWGSNSSGQLGRKPLPYRTRPVRLDAK